MNKYEKLVKDLPSLYQPTVNNVIKGILQAWGKGLDDLDITINKGNKQLFVPTAEGDYLKRLASNAGVVLPTEIGIIDADNRNIIKTMSFNPKQVRLTIWNLLETFYTTAGVYSNITSSIPETYLLVNGYTIEFLVDGIDTVLITFQTSDFEDITAATAFEVANAINKQALGLKIKAEAYYDYLTDSSYVRVFTLSAGSFGSITVVGGLAQYILQFPDVRNVGNETTTQWDVAIYHNDIIRMEWTGTGKTPDLNPLQIEDLLILSGIFSANNIGTFAITDVIIGATVDGVTPGRKYTGTYVEFLNPIAVNETKTQTSNTDVVFYYPYKAQITELPVYATEYETNNKEVVLVIPSTSPIVSRDTIGCTHLHPCNSMVTMGIDNANNLAFEQGEDIAGCDAMYLSGGGTDEFHPGDILTGATSLKTAIVKSAIKNDANDTILAVQGTSGGFIVGESITASSGTFWADVSPGWSAHNNQAYSSAVLGGKLYVGTYNSNPTAQVWSYDGSTWADVSPAWSGIFAASMTVFGGKLYVGVDGAPAQVWSYDGSTWTNVSPAWGGGNGNVFAMAVFGSKLYAETGNVAGSQVWSYDGAIWSNTSLPSAPSTYANVYAMAVLGSKLYVSGDKDGKLYSYDGATWSVITLPSGHFAVTSLTVLGSNLYVGRYNDLTNVGEVWSYDGASWTNTNISWSSGNFWAVSLTAFGSKVYVGSWNFTTGIAEMWSYDGITWTNINAPWATHNDAAYFITNFGSKLYIGTENTWWAGVGAEVWAYDPSGGITATRNFDLLKSTDGGSATISSVLSFNSQLGLDNIGTNAFQIGEAIIGRTVFKTGTVVGSGFIAGEVILGSTSGATATIGELIFVEKGITPSTTGILINITGVFQSGEIITGGTSGSSATLTRVDTSSAIIESINNITDYQSAYLYDSLSPYIVLDTYSLLNQTIASGSSYDLLQCTIVSSDFPTSGQFIIDYGLSTQEGPISFYLTPSSTSIRIDPSFVFQYDHAAGSYIRLIESATATAITDQYGLDYPVYITGIDEARLAFQDLVKQLIAAGITIRFIIKYPVYRFMCYRYVSILVKQYFIPQIQNVPIPDNEWFIYGKVGFPPPDDSMGRGFDQIPPAPAGHLGGGRLKKI